MAKGGLRLKYTDRRTIRSLLWYSITNKAWQEPMKPKMRRFLFWKNWDLISEKSVRKMGTILSGLRIRCFCMDPDPNPVFKFLWIRIRFSNFSGSGSSLSWEVGSGSGQYQTGSATLVKSDWCIFICVTFEKGGLFYYWLMDIDFDLWLIRVVP